MACVNIFAVIRVNSVFAMRNNRTHLKNGLNVLGKAVCLSPFFCLICK